MSATIREVATLAGVSQATAARALNGYGSVRPATQEKVRKAADQLGYRTNPVAQALRRGQSNVIGFVPGDLENPFFASVARGLSDEVEPAGFTVLVSSSDERLEREQTVVRTMRDHLVTGMVVAPAHGADHSHLTALAAAGIPLVTIDRRIPGLDSDQVLVDNAGGTRQGVAHLLASGHRRVGFLGDSLQITSSVERLEGYREALADAGIAVDPSLIVADALSRESAPRTARRLLERDDRPTAIFAGDNLLTLGVLQATRELGLEIPTDVALVGFDDFALTTAYRPAISTVAQPVAEIGREAARLLLRRLQDPSVAVESVRLPTTLIVRESSGT